ncbi:MAG: hypothetical protein QW445_08960 [Candidatus Bathyarchaeia archaeon]
MKRAVAVKVSRAERQAERYFGKIVLLLSEEGAIELSLLAQLLYLPYGKLYYWLVKRRLWNDCIEVEKKDKKLWVSFGGPLKCWLAAVYRLQEPEAKPEFGNEIFKRMVSIGDGPKRTIFAHRLEDNRILMGTFDTLTRKFLFHIQLKPGEVLANGEIAFRLRNEEMRKALSNALNLLGLLTEFHVDEHGELVCPPYLAVWIFETIHIVVINTELLERAFRERVVVVSEEQS